MEGERADRQGNWEQVLSAAVHAGAERLAHGIGASLILKFLYKIQNYDTKTISIAGKGYRAIIADTAVKRAIGLMFKESMPRGSCMLFIFGSPGYHSVWMHNMRFPIDVLWLDKDGVVIDAKDNLTPCSSMLNCPQYSPKAQASYMIELNAGETKREKIRAGSAARI